MQTNFDLPDPLVRELHRLAPEPSGRAELLTQMLSEWFTSHPLAQSELDLINKNAVELNAEAEDVLDYESMQ